MNYLHKKGLDKEIKASAYLHTKGIPLLVDPSLLRSKHAGQIDLAIIKRRSIIIYECKTGIEKYADRFSKNQYRRLQKSAYLLSQVLKLPSIIKII